YLLLVLMQYVRCLSPRSSRSLTLRLDDPDIPRPGGTAGEVRLAAAAARTRAAPEVDCRRARGGAQGPRGARPRAGGGRAAARRGAARGRRHRVGRTRRRRALPSGDAPAGYRPRRRHCRAGAARARAPDGPVRRAAAPGGRRPLLRDCVEGAALYRDAGRPRATARRGDHHARSGAAGPAPVVAPAAVFLTARSGPRPGRAVVSSAGRSCTFGPPAILPGRGSACTRTTRGGSRRFRSFSRSPAA